MCKCEKDQQDSWSFGYLEKRKQCLDKLLEIDLIDFIKTTFPRAIDVEDADQLTVFTNGWNRSIFRRLLSWK